MQDSHKHNRSNAYERAFVYVCVQNVCSFFCTCRIHTSMCVRSHAYERRFVYVCVLDVCGCITEIATDDHGNTQTQYRATYFKQCPPMILYN